MPARAIFMNSRSGTRTCTSRPWPIPDRRSLCAAGRSWASADQNAGPWPGDASVSGGRWRLGSTGADGFIFDNEKWAHEVDIAPFRIAKAPVTNAEFAAFVVPADIATVNSGAPPGGRGARARGPNGRSTGPKPTAATGLGVAIKRFEPLAPHAPVMFVNWYEAEAWCRWAKRRLPTEAEWEAAALGEAADGSCLADSKRRWPWGEAAPAANTPISNSHSTDRSTSPPAPPATVPSDAGR